MAIKYTAVESSNIEGRFYEQKTKKLYVKFKNGREYIYEDVSQEEADELSSAESFSKVFRNLIVGEKKFNEVW